MLLIPKYEYILYDQTLAEQIYSGFFINMVAVRIARAVPNNNTVSIWSLLAEDR